MYNRLLKRYYIKVLITATDGSGRFAFTRDEEFAGMVRRAVEGFVDDQAVNRVAGKNDDPASFVGFNLALELARFLNISV